MKFITLPNMYWNWSFCLLVCCRWCAHQMYSRPLNVNHQFLVGNIQYVSLHEDCLIFPIPTKLPRHTSSIGSNTPDIHFSSLNLYLQYTGQKLTPSHLKSFLFEMILNTNNIYFFFHLQWQFLCKQKWQIDSHWVVCPNWGGLLALDAGSVMGEMVSYLTSLQFFFVAFFSPPHSVNHWCYILLHNITC